MNYEIVPNDDYGYGIKGKTLNVWYDNKDDAWKYSELWVDHIARNYQTNLVLTLLNYTHKPNPKILLVGVAGGSLAPNIKTILPKSFITAIDIDATSEKICKELGTYSYMDELLIQDGFGYINNLEPNSYDIIIADVMTHETGMVTHKTKPFSYLFDPKWVTDTILPKLPEHGIYFNPLEQHEHDSYIMGQSWYEDTIFNIKDNIPNSYITSCSVDCLHNFTPIKQKDFTIIKDYNDLLLTVFKTESDTIRLNTIYSAILDLAKTNPSALYYIEFIHRYRIVHNRSELLGGTTFDAKKEQTQIQRAVNKYKQELLSYQVKTTQQTTKRTKTFNV